MSIHDDALDVLLREEMAVLQRSVPVPGVAMPARDGAARRRSLPLGLRRWDPARPPRLAPAGVAVGLAVLLAAGSGTWFTMERLHARHAAPAHELEPMPRITGTPFVPTPPATPQAGPAALVSTVPAGVPVFYYTLASGQPSGAVRLEAVDWSGQHRGHIDIPGESLPHGSNTLITLDTTLQSPDGERLVYQGAVYASDGRRLYDLPSGALNHFTMWGDDSRSLCWIEGDLGGWHAVVLGPDGVTQHTVPLASHLGADAGYDMDACGISSDRIVAYRTVSSTTFVVTVVQISTGRNLLDESLCPSTCGLLGVSATPDGRMAAESDTNGTVRIRDLTTGVARTLPVHGRVAMLSADGSSLLLGANEYPAAPSFPLQIVDVATGLRRVSMSNAVVRFGDAAVQPGGRNFAYVWRQRPAALPGNYPGDTGPGTLILVQMHGNAENGTTVATGVYSMWFRTY